MQFDTDSAKIGVDNRCSALISNDTNDFHVPVRKVNRSTKAFGGERDKSVYQGMIICKWCNNEGIVHRFIIPNSYYVPAGKCRILSPQCWDKSQSGKNTARKYIDEITTANITIILWNHGRNNLDIP